MNDDDLRDALDSYAAAAPRTDPRPVFETRLARYRRRRNAAVASLACAAVVVAGAGVAALTGGRSEEALLPADPSPTVAASTTTAPAAPSPAPAASASEPVASPTAGPRPSGAAPTPGATTASPSPSVHHDPPPEVTASGRGADGLEAIATLRPGGMPTATEAVLTVSARDDDGDPYVSSVDWGDGTPVIAVVRSESCAQPIPAPPSARAPRPGSTTEERTHAWRHAGTYEIRVVLASSVSCSGDETTESATVTLRVVVTPGEVTGNGPARPVASELGLTRVSGSRAEYELAGYVADADGYVGSVLVDWGDGTTTTVRNGERCDDGGGRYYPDVRGVDVQHRHTYAGDGPYTVTVRFTSTGCDGRDPASGTARAEAS